MNVSAPLQSVGRDAAPAAAARPARQREWRQWALALLTTSLLFGLWPQLDVLLSSAAYDPAAGRAGFVWGELGLVQVVYQAVPWLGRAMLLIGLLALSLGWRRRAVLRPGWRLRWQRRAVALLAVVVLGLGLVVNAGLKEFWGRPRPQVVGPFGGPLPFTPVWQPTKLCHSNCSFVSGHAATGFALIALGLTAAPARRRRWLGIGIATGGLIGLGRVLQGGHFASDIAFAGLVIWGICLGLRELVLRRRAARQRHPSIHAPGAPATANRPAVPALHTLGQG